VCHKAIFVFSETESFLTLHALYPCIGFITKSTPLLFLSVCCPVPNTITTHIIHCFAEFRTFFLLTSSSVGLSLAGRSIFLSVFPALRRTRAVSDQKHCCECRRIFLNKQKKETSKEKKIYVVNKAICYC